MKVSINSAVSLWVNIVEKIQPDT